MLFLPFHPRRAAASLAAAFAALAFTASPALAQQPQDAQRAKTLPQPSTDGKVLGGIKKGSDAAGRGMDRAGDATLSGVNRASESASRPIRNFGEWLGGKLERGPGGAARNAQDKPGAREAP